MAERLEMTKVFKVDGYGLIVYFNDGSEARFTVDELAHLRPAREPVTKVEEADL